MPADPTAPTVLESLETTTDPALHAFLVAKSGPVEGIKLSPDYFYNWENWSNS